MKSILRPNGKIAFLKKLKSNSRILDVGCGNNSPYEVKTMRPDLLYTGIDIGDYNQVKPILADDYIISTPENFSTDIANYHNCFDAIVSSHNLEHCNDRWGTLVAMIGALKRGGVMYLSFPSEATVKFPSRRGTLNYFDDPTHQDTPPEFDKVIQLLEQSNCKVEYSTKQYQPIVFRALGLLVEPFSIIRKKVMRGTWDYYGFETIIWARKS